MKNKNLIMFVFLKIIRMHNIFPIRYFVFLTIFIGAPGLYGVTGDFYMGCLVLDQVHQKNK